MVVVLVLVGGGGRGDFRRSKSAPQRHYQLKLRLYKQKQSIDKQSVIKPHFTRHAGKAGGFRCSFCGEPFGYFIKDNVYRVEPLPYCPTCWFQGLHGGALEH